MNGVDLGRILDNYCERVGTDANFWGEPLNAVSNLAFVLAALWVLVLARREGKLDWSVGALTATLFAVGIGSFLFHRRHAIMCVHSRLHGPQRSM